MELGSLILELQRAADEVADERPEHADLLVRALTVIQEVADISAAAAIRGASCTVSDPCPLLRLSAVAG
jgi:hypothetical protein